ncbi:MAG TPA: sugar nucleotide-binding protein [Candidatus Methylomirabilis sp.]|nr:sugar nucleotide-binding protein [Candidatus Methylomirabilis sp.]
MSRVLIFGPGFLGTKLQEALPDAVLSTACIDDAEDVRAALDEHLPEFVVNAAGKTGTPNVDWCESNKLATYRSNTIGPLVLAEACQERGVHLTHLASGCVFYGPSPDPKGWCEDDHANPSAAYSRSKYAADLLLSTLPNVAILRLRMPIDSSPGPRNLITKLANYPKIIDVENSVTIVDDLIEVVKQIMEKRGEGVFHVTNPGTMRHRDLIRLYDELVDPSHTNEWISNDDLLTLGLAEKGRSNCILQSTRLQALGITMRPIEVALRDCMEKYAAAVKASQVVRV